MGPFLSFTWLNIYLYVYNIVQHFEDKPQVLWKHLIIISTMKILIISLLCLKLFSKSPLSSGWRLNFSTCLLNCISLCSSLTSLHLWVHTWILYANHIKLLAIPGHIWLSLPSLKVLFCAELWLSGKLTNTPLLLFPLVNSTHVKDPLSWTFLQEASCKYKGNAPL